MVQRDREHLFQDNEDLAGELQGKLLPEIEKVIYNCLY